MKNLSILLAIFFSLAISVFGTTNGRESAATAAFPKAPGTVHCWCRMKVGGPDWEGRDWDLGSIATYSGLSPQIKQANKDDCREMCSKQVLAWYEQNKNEICKKFGGAGNTYLIGQSELANNGPEVVETLPIKCCEKPAVVTCPPNTQSQYGYDGTPRCKEQVGCKISPAPSNGTGIGNGWGFFWDGYIIKFIPALFFKPKEVFACDNMGPAPGGPIKVTKERIKSTVDPKIIVQATPEPVRKPE
jgi:hypothetical protein